MKNKLKARTFIYWVPRILAILFAIFITLLSFLFAYEVLSQDLSSGDFSWTTIRAVLMNLIPAFVIIAALLISWKWEIIGGIIFILLGLIIILLFRVWFIGTVFVVLPVLLLLTGLLFLFNKFIK